MKKFFISLLCPIILIMAALGLTACGEKSESTALPDLAMCDIGYQMPMYPTCEFDYAVDENCVVHISHISMTLIAKNTISDGQLLTDVFQPYVFELNATGSTGVEFAGKTIYLRLMASQQYKTQYYYAAVIEQDGSINWTVQQDFWCSASNLFFYGLDFGAFN